MMGTKICEYWTQTFQVFNKEDKVFIPVETAIDFLGLTKKRKKYGWKPFDEFLAISCMHADQEFVGRKPRTAMSLNAFIVFLFGGNFISPYARSDENVRETY